MNPFCLGGGAIAICLVALSMRSVEDRQGFALWSRSTDRNNNRQRNDTKESSAPSPTYPVHPRQSADETECLVEEILANGRAPLLLRPQIIGNLDADQLERAIADLDSTMCLVPSGPVLLHFNADHLEEDERLWKADGQAAPSTAQMTGQFITVNSVFLDRYAVTNAIYQKFVDNGGYEQLALWDEEALPALMDFVDLTGQPGPRFWKNGRYPNNEAKRPVVGVSWFEARAFARWMGKRLPTDAEWTKAGAWPVESSPGCLTQRRYPWGNSFDTARANVWGSEPQQIVDVDTFEEGISVGGISQLVGNVWEWMANPFGDPNDMTLRLPAPMKSLRGGAYDTYFENQATCHFQSGDSPLARRHNIGFRLAISSCDLAPEATGLHDSASVSLSCEYPYENMIDDDASMAMSAEVI
ncbi:MAG: SUMF1/EgtB/PvdO family nonheme iron enzyme [Pirellulales bacterium]|nr:SUMF1/EgtB/PvdO family nonheme iron enzyme [Pirellulales bacterium]